MRRTATTLSRRRTAAWLAGLTLAAALPAIAEDAAEKTAVDQPPAAAAPAGLRAFIDPETGELTSTPSRRQIEELSRLIEQQTLSSVEGPLSRSSAGLETFELATGGRGVHLKGRFQHALAVRVVEVGELELVCRDDAPKTDHQHPAVTPAEWAEK